MRHMPRLAVISAVRDQSRAVQAPTHQGKPPWLCGGRRPTGQPAALRRASSPSNWTQTCESAQAHWQQPSRRRSAWPTTGSTCGAPRSQVGELLRPMGTVGARNDGWPVCVCECQAGGGGANGSLSGRLVLWGLHRGSGLLEEGVAALHAVTQ